MFRLILILLVCIASPFLVAQQAIASNVRRQGFWHQWQLNLRESLAHLVGFIMRRVVCDASVAFQASFV